MESRLFKRQAATFRKDFVENGEPITLVVSVRHDDRCGNGHNTFSIIAERFGPGRHNIGEPTIKHESGKTLCLSACGCLHDDIAEHFPELAPLLKWHLCSTDGPLHYIANTMYFANCRKLDLARKVAIWPDATDEELTAPGLEECLTARLPKLLEDFRSAVESLGMEW